MRITSQKLRTTRYEVKGDSTDSKPRSLEPSTAKLPASLPRELAAPASSFAWPQSKQANQDLMKFCDNECFATLSPETGLPRFLFGELEKGSLDEYPSPNAFLKRNERMLSGLPRGTRLRKMRQSRWDDGTYQVAFYQVNRFYVPLYGAGIVCRYFGNALTSITNHLYPAPPKVIDHFDWNLKPVPWSSEAVLNNLPDGIRPVKFLEPPNRRGESRKKDWLGDRWILPYVERWIDTRLPSMRNGSYEPTHDEVNLRESEPSRSDSSAKAGATATFRPVWRLVIVDNLDNEWLVLVDAETADILVTEPICVGLNIQAEIFAKPVDAQLNSLKLTVQQINLGQGSQTMAAALQVHVKGDRFKEPTDATVSVDLRRLSANTFFHTLLIQDQFRTMFGTLGLTLRQPNLSDQDPTKDINIDLQNRALAASYNWRSRTLEIARGITTGTAPVHEPGYDCDVIYHEFTHAVTRYLNSLAFKFTSTEQQEATRAVDEGMAFYFACQKTNESLWADFAYRDWKDNHGESLRDLAQRLLTLAEVEAEVDQADKAHGIGMWWARVFWRIKELLGPDSCNRLLLQAWHDLSAPVSSAKQFALHLVSLSQANQNQVEAVLHQFGLDL